MQSNSSLIIDCMGDHLPFTCKVKIKVTMKPKAISKLPYEKLYSDSICKQAMQSEL